MKNRRELFTELVSAAKVVVNESVPQPQWPLPPGAGAPADFLAKCTKCGDCIEACPYGAIGRLPEGGPYGGRPAMNPNKAPCHLCEHMDCAKSCTAGALMVVPWSAVFMGLAEIEPNKCIVNKGPECGACEPACPLGALTMLGGKPKVDTDVCNGCGLCRQSCPVWDKAINVF